MFLKHRLSSHFHPRSDSQSQPIVVPGEISVNRKIGLEHALFPNFRGCKVAFVIEYPSLIPAELIKKIFETKL